MIGSVDTSEFMVAAAASIGFFIGIGNEGVKAGYVLALLAGGVARGAVGCLPRAPHRAEDARLVR